VTPAPGQPGPPRLRRDLTIHPAEAERDGAPAWSLHDPAANQFFRLGSVEADLLALVDGSPADRVAAEAARRFGHRVSEADVATLFAFLRRYNLVDGDPWQQASFVAYHQKKPGPLHRMLHSYISFRVPLVRPDRFLAATLPWVRWLGSGWTLAAILLLGLAGLFLASRQWEVFRGTFIHFVSAEGLVAYAVTVTAVKALHELGHAYAAKARGLRIPVIGIAFIVFWPVAYTDATDAWKLKERRDRLVVGAAGVGVEFAIACLSLLLWNLMPDGPARSVAFLMATSTWLLSVLVNLNPLMRFDGYFLFSDLMREPNLETRSHAVGRWWLRRTVFGFSDPPPERPRALLLGYALSIWLYRFLLYTGIAIVVYELFFKLAGIVLFAIEIIYFVGAPIMRELAEWWRRRRDIGLTFALLRSLCLLGLAGLAFMAPWHRTVLAPAVLEARYSPVFAPEGGRVKRLLVHRGERVAAGQLLAELEAPQLAHDLEQARRRLDQLVTERGDLGVQKDLKTTLVVTAELESQVRLLANLTEAATRLRLVAAHGGTVVDMERGLDGPSESWVQKGETLFAIVDSADVHLRAYIGEEDLPRLTVGAAARFYPGDGLNPALPVTVGDIDTAGVKTLDDPYVSSVNGGPVLVYRDAAGSQTPVSATYGLRLIPAPETAGTLPDHVTPGVVMIDARPESLFTHFRRRIIAVLQRESGF